MKNNDAPRRPRGRPRGFDRDAALAKATEIFWHLGYEGASIADLTAAMGITPQSLYAAFSSKAALYGEALALYQRGIGAGTSEALRADMATVDAFACLLKEAAQRFCRSGQPRGCMVSNAVLACAEENRPVAEHARALRRGAVAAFRARIERGMAEGDMRPDTDADALAHYVAAVVQGMSVQAQDGADEQMLMAIATMASAEVSRHRK